MAKAEAKARAKAKGRSIKKAKPKIVKKKKVVKDERLRRGSLRAALLSGLKAQSGRSDLSYNGASAYAAQRMSQTPLKDRPGYPLSPGPADPAKWRTQNGKQVIVDFTRHAWLPDDWGQGVKITEPTAHSTGGGGGTYTVIVSPCGKIFYHRRSAEEWLGKKFELKDGFRGQLRTAWLQGRQVQAGNDTDKSFFKVLSAKERRNLPKKEEFHFAVVSARRTRTPEGVKDLAVVEAAFKNAGVTPTWYVDAESVKEYQALGLKAVVGGKLTPSRNKALQDARRMRKACVQCSDDISAWEYRHGAKAADRTDDAVNAAFNKSTRYLVSPVAAARFLLAKMRAAEGKQPQLGGVYMLSSCSRSFGGDEVSRQHFILGDFFVVDKSKVNFDSSMTLKEDYDFTCSHIKAHGSVLRCNRMTVHAKHYSNVGGACANRDKKGVEECKNIDILFRKWPNAFQHNWKRKNEVILRWKKCDQDE
mmetsp:Transcript_58642/g.172065  ORF Transcript_58642/g.172065 Transcript_58642/m.172065 type:complete len:475 (-) Transcript_58642:51-1475(-)